MLAIISLDDDRGTITVYKYVSEVTLVRKQFLIQDYKECKDILDYKNCRCSKRFLVANIEPFKCID